MPGSRLPAGRRTVRLNRTAYCHKKTYVQYQGIERSFDPTLDGCQWPVQNISQKSGTSARDFCFPYPIEKSGLNLSEFGVRMSQLSPGLLMSVHRTIQTYGPSSGMVTSFGISHRSVMPI